MALKGATWYQGESNVGAAAYYACGFPSMITRCETQRQPPPAPCPLVTLTG